MTIHRRLEEALAEFKGAEACVLFGSGYLANTGIVAALASDAVVLSDALNHASIVDGCRLARAETVVYEHADVEHLEWGLQQAEGRPAVIVTDSVFSMDGDVAPLEEICGRAPTAPGWSWTTPTGQARWDRAGAGWWPSWGSRARWTSSWARSASHWAPMAPMPAATPRWAVTSSTPPAR
jgi:hypothetical protein